MARKDVLADGWRVTERSNGFVGGRTAWGDGCEVTSWCDGCNGWQGEWWRRKIDVTDSEAGRTGDCDGLLWRVSGGGERLMWRVMRLVGLVIVTALCDWWRGRVDVTGNEACWTGDCDDSVWRVTVVAWYQWDGWLWRFSVAGDGCCACDVAGYSIMDSGRKGIKFGKNEGSLLRHKTLTSFWRIIFSNFYFHLFFIINNIKRMQLPEWYILLKKIVSLPPAFFCLHAPPMIIRTADCVLFMK